MDQITETTKAALLLTPNEFQKYTFDLNERYQRRLRFVRLLADCQRAEAIAMEAEIVIATNGTLLTA